MAMTRWTSGRVSDAPQPGHNSFISVLRRAAMTTKPKPPLLFGHAGLDPTELAKQGDRLLVDAGRFAKTTAPFEISSPVPRSDPANGG